jgi:hypothetical protein
MDHLLVAGRHPRKKPWPVEAKCHLVGDRRDAIVAQEIVAYSPMAWMASILETFAHSSRRWKQGNHPERMSPLSDDRHDVFRSLGAHDSATAPHGPHDQIHERHSEAIDIPPLVEQPKEPLPRQGEGVGHLLVLRALAANEPKDNSGVPLEKRQQGFEATNRNL